MLIGLGLLILSVPLAFWSACELDKTFREIEDEKGVQGDMRRKIRN